MKKNKEPSISIKDWSEADRPREKLLLKGQESLSEAELLAILIGSGSRSESAVELCRRILLDASNKLGKIARYEIIDLTKYKGIGEAKAISIIAALELGRRRLLENPTPKPSVLSSQEAYNVIGPQLSDLNHEEFWVLILDRKGRCVKKVQVSKGGVSATYVDQKIIWKHAIEQLGSSIVLVHNHPSGVLLPSINDQKLTKRIVQGGVHLGIRVNDHLIVGDGNYYSFADEGEECLTG